MFVQNRIVRLGSHQASFFKKESAGEEGVGRGSLGMSGRGEIHLW